MKKYLSEGNFWTCLDKESEGKSSLKSVEKYLPDKENKIEFR